MNCYKGTIACQELLTVWGTYEAKSIVNADVMYLRM